MEIRKLGRNLSNINMLRNKESFSRLHFWFPSSSFNCLLRAPSEILRLDFDGTLHDAIACTMFLHIADLVAHHHWREDRMINRNPHSASASAVALYPLWHWRLDAANNILSQNIYHNHKRRPSAINCKHCDKIHNGYRHQDCQHCGEPLMSKTAKRVQVLLAVLFVLGIVGGSVINAVYFSDWLSRMRLRRSDVQQVSVAVAAFIL